MCRTAAFFWHGHFATSVVKVRSAAMMLAQNEVFRAGGAGGFDALALAVARDPAMLVWLDAGRNSREHPNENFARELMELFTLGLGNYSEADVREAARAFTGWRVDAARTGFTVAGARHDNGVKTVLGHTGSLSGEDVVTLVARSPVSASFVTARLFSRFAAPTTPDANPARAAMLTGYGTRSLLRVLVVVVLHGGNDRLCMDVPVDDAAYGAARPGSRRRALRERVQSGKTFLGTEPTSLRTSRSPIVMRSTTARA